MEPTIRSRDYVLVAATDRYQGEGIYLIDRGLGEDAFRVDGWGTKAEPLRLTADSKLYKHPPELVSVAEFERIVVGKVAMTCRVQDPDLIRTSFTA